jgi:hypothetical protein
MSGSGLMPDKEMRPGVPPDERSGPLDASPGDRLNAGSRQATVTTADGTAWTPVKGLRWRAEAAKRLPPQQLGRDTNRPCRAPSWPREGK